MSRPNADLLNQLDNMKLWVDIHFSEITPKKAEKALIKINEAWEIIDRRVTHRRETQ